MVRLTSALASSNQTQESLRTQLRSQSSDLDHLEAEISDHRATIGTLQSEISRIHAAQQAGTQDLLQLARRLLALAHATGAELDIATQEIFRRRGWTTATRKTEARQ